jgi:hypothetical protein
MKQIAKRLSVGLLVLVGLTAWSGCGHAPPEEPPQESAPNTPTEETSGSADRTVWDVVYIQGAKVGYVRITTSRLVRDGQAVVRIEQLSHMAIKRFGQTTEITIETKSHQTPEGKLLDFESRLAAGPAPMVTRGRPEGDKLILETTTQGKTQTTSIPWSDEIGGFHAVEQTLLERPMQPGERRTVRILVPVFNGVATVELLARDFESVELLSGSYNLLRIDTTTTLADGQTIPGTLWTDRTGDVLKTFVELMQQESYRATKALALDETNPPELDFGHDIRVKVARALSDPHHTKRIRYRVRWEGGDPAGVFVSGDSQQVKSVDPHTIDVTVRSIRPGDSSGDSEPPTEQPVEQPAPDNLKPSPIVQSDNPDIVAVAKRVAGDRQDHWQAAVALERYVGGHITGKGYSQAFATAADVFESRKGDCTEHAVLLAALARARGIPARVAMGLVYDGNTQSFLYHMWTEVFVGKRWIPLDATLAEGGIGAAHLKLAHSSLQGASAFSSFLPVARVAGRLKIEILEVE